MYPFDPHDIDSDDSKITFWDIVGVIAALTLLFFAFFGD